jgi:hypothetical protein
MEEFETQHFDYTRLSDFLMCPRRGYFAHIRSWQPELTSPALVFGISWHRAMETIYSNPTADKGVLTTAAFSAFQTEWDASGLDPEEFHPRSLNKAVEMLDAYLDKYYVELTRTKVLDVERAFEVPLNVEGQPTYHGRLDTIVELPTTPGIFVLEHKTTSSFMGRWSEFFSPNMQIDGYCHAAHMIYGDNVRGVLVNGAIIQKTKIDFVRVPVVRQFEELDAWAWEILDWIETIKFDYERLAELRVKASERAPKFMNAFPKNTTGCSHFGGCRYLDLCKITSNPERWDEPPGGFVYKPWDYRRS